MIITKYKVVEAKIKYINLTDKGKPQSFVESERVMCP